MQRGRRINLNMAQFTGHALTAAIEAAIQDQAHGQARANADISQAGEIAEARAVIAAQVVVRANGGQAHVVFQHNWAVKALGQRGAQREICQPQIDGIAHDALFMIDLPRHAAADSLDPLRLHACFGQRRQHGLFNACHDGRGRGYAVGNGRGRRLQPTVNRRRLDFVPPISSPI